MPLVLPPRAEQGMPRVLHGAAPAADPSATRAEQSLPPVRARNDKRCGILYGSMSALTICRIEPAEPLHKRVPSRDEHGRALTDFMVLMPELRDLPGNVLEGLAAKMQLLFAHYGHAVRFAELNLKLNLLWVSVKPISGIRYEIAGALQQLYPGARLVCHI